MFKKYQHIQNAELRPYIKNEDMSNISISQFDKDNGSPKKGDMIARNPKNYNHQWLVSKQYFKDNYKPVDNVEKISGFQNMIETHLNDFVKGKKIKVYVDDVKNPMEANLEKREWATHKTTMLVCSVDVNDYEKYWSFNLTTLNGDINNPIVDVDLWYTDNFKLFD